MLTLTIRKKQLWFLILKYISYMRLFRVYSNFGQFETGPYFAFILDPFRCISWAAY
jgi:hypothetical protein